MKTTTSIKGLVSLIFFFSSYFLHGIAIYCPDDVWVDCDAELWDLSEFGNASYWNGWDYVDAGEPVVTWHTNSCNVGYIKRKWTVEDENWNVVSCHQIIHIEGGVFDEDNIEWPESPLLLEGCDPNTDPSETGSPEHDYIECSLIGTNKSDMLFHLGPGCKKLLRTWTVIDWCTYNPDLGYGSPGSFQFTQEIKISNNDEPTVQCIDEIQVGAYNCEDEYVTVPVPEISEGNCSSGFTITHNSPYADQPGSDASGIYPIGKTTVKFTIAYGCGSKEFCYVDVNVKDNSTPVPYCLMSVVTALMPMDENGDGVPEDGMVEIWASDFDHGSYHPCNYGPLQFSFSEDIDSTSAIFTCAHVGTNELRMYVTDPYGNQSYCVVELVIQNNAANIPNCEPEIETQGFSLSGIVTNSLGDQMAETAVRIKSNEKFEHIINWIDTQYTEEIVDSFYNYNGVLIYIIDTLAHYTEMQDTLFDFYEKTITTESNGSYVFQTLQNDILFTVNAYKEDYPEERVTIQDAFLLRDYINGDFETEDPYFMLAADMNFDGKINYDDYYDLFRIVRDPNDENVLTEPWILLDPEKDMSDIENACHINVTLDSNLVGANFLGVLRGDLTSYFDESEEKLETGNRSYDTWEILVYPNPFKERLFLDIDAPEATDVSISISDITGKLLGKRAYSVSKGKQRISLDQQFTLIEKGVFIVKVEKNNEVILHQKMIKT